MDTEWRQIFLKNLTSPYIGRKGGKNKKVTIPARPYLHLTDDDFEEILNAAEEFLSNSDLLEN